MNVEEDTSEKEFERYISRNDTTEEGIWEEIFEEGIKQYISEDIDTERLRAWTKQASASIIKCVTQFMMIFKCYALGFHGK